MKLNVLFIRMNKDQLRGKKQTEKSLVGYLIVVIIKVVN